MAIEQILALLIAERNKVNQALEALQGPIHRRGRPPKNSPAIATTAPTTKKRRTFTMAQRRQQAERMRLFWAAKRKAEAKSQRTPAGKPKENAK